MKTWYQILLLSAVMLFAAGCQPKTEAEIARHEAMEQAIKTCHAGDLLVDDTGKPWIVERIYRHQLWLESRDEPRNLSSHAWHTKRIVRKEDPDWAATLQNYYRDYEAKYWPK